jgi:hypothetical protein
MNITFTVEVYAYLYYYKIWIKIPKKQVKSMVYPNKIYGTNRAK